MKNLNENKLGPRKVYVTAPPPIRKRTPIQEIIDPMNPARDGVSVDKSSLDLMNDYLKPRDLSYKRHYCKYYSLMSITLYIIIIYYIII